MIGFERTAVWLLALPWVVFCLWLWWIQRAAIGAAERHVAARFRDLVTRYSQRSMTVHLGGLLLLGLGLVAVVAGPVPRERRPPPAAGGRLLLIFDASASMYATDVEPLEARGEGDDEAVARFAVARSIGRQMLGELDGMRFAIASFSGEPTLNLPMTSDRALVDQALAMLATHTFYRNTGSSLTEALEMVFHFTGDTVADLQVVILGDGEQPFAESYEEPLASLVEIGVPVHTVAIGSPGGQTRLIYDFNDVVAGKEDKRVLREYTTRRVERHFAEISSRTGGRFVVGRAGEIPGLIEAIRADAEARSKAEAQPDATDWSSRILLAALAMFLAHIFCLAPPPAARRPGFGFDIERLGAGPAASPATLRARKGGAALLLAVLLPLVSSCGQSLRLQAHRANESGLALDELGQFDAARRQFERSASLGYRPEVPTHNLARALSRRGDFTEAHELFQSVIELEPGLVDAHFNDGVTLYEWGLAERDPRDCQLDRTLELWRGAERRFASITGGVVEIDQPAARAAENLRRIETEIAALEELIAEPPEHCRSESPQSSQGQQGGGGGGNGEQDQENQGSNDDPEEPPPPGGSPPPPPGGQDAEPGRGPLSEDELDRIGSELGRIASQASEPGKYYRRTGREQFTKQDWSRPDPEIWW